jgi:hypothetical protein
LRFGIEKLWNRCKLDIVKSDESSTRAGIKEIAKSLGISIGTVDSALHNRPGITMDAATSGSIAAELFARTLPKPGAVAGRFCARIPSAKPIS